MTIQYRDQSFKGLRFNHSGRLLTHWYTFLIVLIDYPDHERK